MRAWFRHSAMIPLILLVGCATTGDLDNRTIFWSSRKADILLAEKRAALDSANSNLKSEQDRTAALRKQETELLQRRADLEMRVAKLEESLAAQSAPAPPSNGGSAGKPAQPAPSSDSDERAQLSRRLRELDQRLKDLQNRPRADTQALESELLRLEQLIEEAQRRILKLGQSN